ncbi:MAG: DUF167 domain-containing protein [Nanoarchaeota archaeon]
MIIKVKVKPNASNNKIEKLSENNYYISTTEKAESGKANTSIIKLLSKEFNTNYKNIKIKNPTSRNKIISIKNINL